MYKFINLTKKVIYILILLLTLVLFISCDEKDIGNINDNNQNNQELPEEKDPNTKNPVIKESENSDYLKLTSETWSYETYDSSVTKINSKEELDSFCVNNDLLKNGDYYLVDDTSKMLMIHSVLLSMKLDLITEKSDEFFNNNVMLLMLREVSKTNELKSEYYYDEKDNTLVVTYPDNKNTNNDIQTKCLDLITLSKETYLKLYPTSKDNEKNYYKLTCFNTDEVISELKEYYQEGEEVVIKTCILCDAGIEGFLDNHSIGTEYSVDDHWEFYFTMPNHDASLYLRAYNGFKPYYEDVEKYIPKSILSFGTQDGIIHDYLYANGRTPENGEKGYIDSYYGFYNNTFVLKMSTNKSDYTEAEGVETVGGVTFHYNNGNRILAYKNGKFYSLQEAYNNGYLTTTDLQNCLTFNNDYIEPIKYSLNEIVDVSLSNIKEVEFKRWGAIETTYKLSNKGITDFISDINTNYTLSSQEEIYLLNNVETGLFFKYTVYTKGLTFEVCPIYTTPKIYIKINDKIYLSYNEIKLSNDYDKENEEKIVNTISLDLVNEIKISYIKTYRSEKTPLTLEEFDKIKIRYYLGIFNGYHVVMIDGYNSLYQTPMLDIIGDITFNYTDNNYFLVYKDGFFDTLSNAYKKGLITNKLINEINNLYINSTPYNIIIEDYKTDDKLVLSDLVDISLYEYINVIDIKKKELIINELEFTNLSVDTKELINKILASECVLLDEISIKTLISKEYEISLSNKPSFSSYKYFISFILGQNMIYSSIKVELIVEVNNVKYLVNADRNDLFTLYNLIIKYQKGQENKDIILSDLLDINTLNRVYISNATDDLVSTNVRLEDLNEDTKNIIKRILASKCIVLDKNMLIQDEYNLIVKGEDDHYTFTFGENMLYSSIKKELVIKFTDVSYLIQADRDDLFNLYLLIKKHEDLFNQSELKFDEIYPMLNDEITKISVINRINDLSSETSLYILNNIDSLSFQGINYVNNLKYYEVDQKDQLNTIIEKLKEITLMNISNNKVVTDYPQYMFPLTISSIAIIKPLDMYTYIIETENDKIELFIMANGTDYFTFIDGVFFNVSNIIEETFLPEPLICDYLRFPSTSISDIKEYIQRRLDTGIKSNILNFSDCFPWINEINVEDIISIKQINELNETKEINDKEIISKLFDSLKNDKLLLSLNLIELSLNPVRYEICTKDNTYRFEKNSGYIVYKGNIFVIGSYLEDAFID